MAATSAIREIKAQLQKQGGKGKVWIDNWTSKYGEQLGCTIREFMESRPEVKVIPAGGSKYEVMLSGAAGKAASGKAATPKATPAKAAAATPKATPAKAAAAPGKAAAAGKSAPGGKAATAYRATAMAALTNGKDAGGGKASGGGKSSGKGWSSGGQSSGGWNPKVAEAIREIRAQLEAQGGAGQVWVDGWKGRFQGELGSLKEFLESRPDKFMMSYGGGNKFSVSLLTGGGYWVKVDEAPTKASKHENKRKMPWEQQAAPPAKKVARGAKASLAEEAAREATKQLKRPSNTEGKVWINNWGWKFADTLGTLREFLESQSDKFIIVPGEGTKFTVSLIDA